MANPALDLNQNLARAVDAAAPAVLRLARRRYPASATVWEAADGLVVTAAHAIASEDEVHLTTAAGDERDAQVVGRDPGTDLALLRTDPAGLTAIAARELDGIAVGHLALALARPGQSVRASLRIVGVLGPEIRTPTGGKLDRYLETDRSFPRGFSGGPLVDLEGKAIGIDTSGLLRGADITVPTATVRRVVAELRAHGSVRRGYLGIAVQRARVPGELVPSIGQETGALIVRVDPDSAAARGGLVMGDLLVRLDGERVAGPDELREVLADRCGVEIEVQVVRVGKLERLRVKVGEQ